MLTEDDKNRVAAMEENARKEYMATPGEAWLWVISKLREAEAERDIWQKTADMYRDGEQAAETRAERLEAENAKLRRVLDWPNEAPGGPGLAGRATPTTGGPTPTGERVFCCEVCWRNPTCGNDCGSCAPGGPTQGEPREQWSHECTGYCPICDAKVRGR